MSFFITTVTVLASSSCFHTYDVCAQSIGCSAASSVLLFILGVFPPISWQF